MDVAGMEVVLGADYDQLEKGFSAATRIMENFKRETLSLAKVRIAPTISIKDLNKLTQLNLAVQGLKQSVGGGIALDIKTTDLSQLLASLKQVQALSNEKKALQVTASGKGIEGLNNSLRKASTYAEMATNALNALQAAANTSMQFLAAQNAQLASFLGNIGVMSSQATQSMDQLSNATATAAAASATAAQESATSSTQAAGAAESMVQAFNGASASSDEFSQSLLEQVAIYNNLKARMGEISTQISALSKMQGLNESETNANKATINQLGAEYSKLSQKIGQARSAMNASSKGAIAAEGSYNALQAQLSLLNQRIRNLPKADFEGTLGAGMKKLSAEWQEELKQMDATMGIHVRNVGNYSGSLTFLNQSMAQLTGELPNFFQSMKIGFMSISNNIQPIMMALQNLKEENIKLAASGQPTVSAFGAMTKAIFGWQTLLFVGVGLLSRYGGDLAEMAGNAISNKTAVDKLADSQKEYASKLADSKDILKGFTDSLKSAHDAMVSNVESAGKTVGQIKLLTATMTDGNQTMFERRKAYDQLVAIAPEIAGAINKELTLTTQLADAINTKLIPALIQKAKAEGFSEQYKKLASDQSAAIIKQTELTESYNKALANAKGFAALEDHFKNSGKAAASFFDQIGLVVSTVKSLGADRDFEKQRKALDLVNAEVNEYGKHMDTALKLFLDANQYASTLYKTLNAGEGDQKKALQDHIKALQAQMDLVKKGTPRYAELEAEVHKAQEELKAYNITTKNAKQHVDALTKSQNNLQAALKQVDSQLQSGQITSLEAAKQKLNAYQKDLQTLFQHGGGKIKIDADLSGITDLQKQIKELTAADVLKKLNEALNIDAQLNTAGATTQLEKVKSDLNAAKQAFKDLVSGKNALSLDDSKVIKVKNEAADLEKQLQALTKQQKIDLAIKTGDAKGLDISQDLQNGWLTPLEAAKERVKALETELKALQKAGAASSVIIPVKVQLASDKQDLAVKEVQDIINKTFAKSDAKSIAAKINVGFELTTNVQEAQQKLRADTQALKDTLNELMQNLPEGAKDALNKGLATAFNPGDIAKLVQDSIKSLPANLQKAFQDAFSKGFENLSADKATAKFADFVDNANKTLNQMAIDGLAGVGEMIGAAISGGDVGNIFGSMMQNIGGQLENLGKWMITTATKFTILKKAFEDSLKANPVLGIVAGIATVALGAALKGAFQNKQSQMAFADGGIVYGRTNAIIGEYQGAKNNPEVVAPLNKLKNILQVEQGGAQRVEVVGVIDNDVIRLASQRSDIKSRR